MQVLTSVINLPAGLYVLRHPGQGMPPLTVSRTPGSNARIETLLTNNVSGMVLKDGADCIVMHALDSVELLIAAFAAKGVAVVPAVKLDRIALESRETVPAKASVDTPKLVIKDKGISIVGHVERKGDVVAAEGEVFGNPALNHRVEGFQVMWPDRPTGVDLVYGVTVEGVGALPPKSSGNFIGTRREAKRITEASFALIGASAKRYQLNGTAYFSGGFQVPVSAGAQLSGPTGLEHLTGLTLTVSPAAERNVKAKNLWAESPKTKVFSAKKPASTTKEKAAKKVAVTTSKSRKAA